MTKASPEMKLMQGVHRPEGSVNWHYQKKLPKDLQGHPEAPRNGWGHRGTLGTSDLREANCRAAQLLAELEERWALMRQALTIMPPQAAPPRTGRSPWSAVAVPKSDATRWWYDLLVTCTADPNFLQRLTGHMEPGTTR